MITCQYSEFHLITVTFGFTFFEAFSGDEVLRGTIFLQEGGNDVFFLQLYTVEIQLKMNLGGMRM